MYTPLRDELVVDDVYLRVLVRDAAKQRGMGDAKKISAAATGLGQGLPLPSDLLVSAAIESCM